ncbi:helix-turn-helix transcriptional regulator [Micrococcales bacterium 31B]|nr:helix-turn-helix transcriptional regulator [Micrococcales bacterium 31B]
MVVTLDLRSTPPSAVTVQGSPLIETMALLHLVTEREHHVEQRAVIEATYSALPPAVFAQVEAFAPLWSRLRCRLFFPLDARSLPEWEPQLAALEGLDLASFTTLAAEGVLGLGRRGQHADLIARPGDFVAACRARATARGDLAQRLVDDPQRFRGDLLGLLHEVWEAAGARDWVQSRPRLERAAEQARDDLQRDLATAFANLSDTAEVAGPGRVAFDKLDTFSLAPGAQPLYVIPSLLHAPHLTIKSGEGRPLTVVYPVGRAPEQLSLQALQSRLEALASPFRMRLLRHLLSEAQTTSELALRLAVDDSQVSRALSLLRKAGVVHSVRSGGTLLHHADAVTLRRLGVDVVRTILR